MNHILSKIKYVSVSVMAASLLMGCSSKKEVAATTEEKPRVVESSEGFRTLSMDKATFTLYNAAGGQTSLNGSIRIARDSVILCSITPFVGVNMEFAKICINKQGITILDRINKRYFQVTFDEAKEKYGMQMNYNAYESVFTNRVFLYNIPYMPLASDFEIADLGDQILFTRSDEKVSQEFYFNTAKTLLGGMLAAGKQYSMRWSYSEFEVYNGVNFPKQLSLKLAGPNFHKQCRIQYKNVELDRDRSFKFEIPESYSKVELDELLKMIS